MKFLRTFVFFLLFVTVALLYAYQKYLAKEALINTPDEVTRNVVLSPEDVIDGVTLIDHVQKTQLILRNGKEGWMMESPVRYPLERGIGQGFAIAGRMASRQTRLRAEKDWGEYGLEKPEMEILFDLPGKKPETLLLGAQAPVGKAVYARWRGERGYFLLSPEMKAMFRQSAYSLREKRIFRVAPEKFRKIYLEMGPYSCQWKKDGGVWYWMEPVSKLGQKASGEEPYVASDAIEGLHVKEFLDNNRRSKAELGFFMIHDRIRVETDDGQVLTLQLGNEVPERSAYYGFVEGDDLVFLVDRGKIIKIFDLVRKIGERELQGDAIPAAGDALPQTKKL